MSTLYEDTKRTVIGLIRLAVKLVETALWLAVTLLIIFFTVVYFALKSISVVLEKSGERLSLGIESAGGIILKTVFSTILFITKVILFIIWPFWKPITLTLTSIAETIKVGTPESIVSVLVLVGAFWISKRLLSYVRKTIKNTPIESCQSIFSILFFYFACLWLVCGIMNLYLWLITHK